MTGKVTREGGDAIADREFVAPGFNRVETAGPDRSSIFAVQADGWPPKPEVTRASDLSCVL
jgi:hypothetical protein